MFDTIVFVEKPAQARLLAPHLASRHDPTRTLVMSLMLTGPFGFNYPRGLARSQYPRVTVPQYKLRSNFDWLAQPLATYLSADGATQVMPAEEALAALRANPALVYAGDPDATGIHNFWLVAQELCGQTNLEMPAYLHYELGEPALAKAVAHPETTLALASELEAAHVKRYFDWNWNQNALVAFGPALQAVAPGHAMLSKYALQVLYFCQRYQAGPGQPPLSLNLLHKLFPRWPGTGKYPPGRLGSATSQHAIIEQLQTAGLLSTSNTLRVLPAGVEFLSRLHKDCLDLDLPQRLADWMRHPLVEVKPAMDAYLQRYFGRQLRYQA